MARDTREGWRAAFALLRREPWRAPAVIALLWLAPALIEGRAGRAEALVSLLRMLLCTPLMYAVLARLQFTRLRGGGGALLATVHEKLRQWRALLLLAALSMLLSRFLMFIPSVAAWVLQTVASLLGWIPGIGLLLNVVTLILLTALATCIGFVQSQGLYCLWLAQEDGGGPPMGALSGAWRFFRRRLSPLAGLFFTLTVAGAVWLLLPLRAPGTQEPVGARIIFEGLAVWAGSGYVAALYGADRGKSVRAAQDPYAAPGDIGGMKSANPSEE